MTEDEIEKLRIEIKNEIDQSEGEEWHADGEGDEYKVEIIETDTASFRIIELLKQKGLIK